MKRSRGTGVARGIAKWLVDVFDETGETVASRDLGSDNLDDGEEVGPELSVTVRAND